MEELHKTQEHPLERERQERRQAQQPYEGEDRRREVPPVSEQDGTRRG